MKNRAAVAALKRRGGCIAATFGVVRIRLARFALPRLGLGGSKSGVSCSPLVCRVRGTIENVRASASRPEAVSIAPRDYRLSENDIEKLGLTYFLNMFRAVIPFAALPWSWFANCFQGRSYHRILQNPVVNGCGENSMRNILNLSQVRMRSVTRRKG